VNTIDIKRSTISNRSDYGILSLGQSSVQISNSTIESLNEAVASQNGSTAGLVDDSRTPRSLGCSLALSARELLGGAIESERRPCILSHGKTAYTVRDRNIRAFLRRPLNAYVQ
jgi:hypothetical protein